MTNWLKKHHIIHTWSKWEQYKQIFNVTFDNGLKFFKEEKNWQKRHCEECNKEQREEA